MLLSAKPVLAAVSINEIAWMGGVDSANHEWIELYNSSDTAVVVDGWEISDGMNLKIKLVGSIPAGEYAVLERTSEESSPATAFLLYTGALVNTGVTLTITDAAGGIVDQVTGGENWQNIGGDNTTKETAQYTTKGWVTDSPTPGKVNGSGRSEIVPAANNSTDSNTTTKKSGGVMVKSSTVNLKVPESKISLKPEVQTVAYVNQVIPFRVIGEVTDRTTAQLISYDWNFGDSYTDTGREVKHFYRYPGNYVVTIYAKFNKLTQVARHDITVLPVDFSITRNEEGDIQINNDAPYDIDISGYRVRGEEEIILPARTIMLPRATLTIEKTRLGGNNDTLITLYDAKENLVTSTNESYQSVASAAIVPEVVASEAMFGEDFPSPSAKTNLADFILPPTVEASGPETPETPSSTIEIKGKTESYLRDENGRLFYLTFIGLLLAALAMIFLIKGKHPENK